MRLLLVMDLNSWIVLCCNLQQADLIMMESMVLSSLNFRISMPTVFTFLSLYQQAVGMSRKAEALSSYIAVRPAIKLLMT